MTEVEKESFQCPLPLRHHSSIVLAHGGGGRLMHHLIDLLFRPLLSDPGLDRRHDAAALEATGGRMAFTTDSYVVHPLFFPGGDIGSLAVHGTVNDLAMAGALPLYLSCAFILEEGLPLETLTRVVESMARAARASGVAVVTGDTKVVDRGKGDGIFINTAGIGVIKHGLEIDPRGVRPGDVCVLSGDVGRHGVAILNAREELSLESAIESDSAPVAEPVLSLIDAGVEVRCLRDLTRGGLAAALIEIAETRRIDIEIRERAIPVREDVRGACEILGLDPVHIANEGRFIAFVAPGDEAKTLDLLRRHPISAGAVPIGRVAREGTGLVSIESRIGVRRILDMPVGEQLPRIC